MQNVNQTKANDLIYSHMEGFFLTAVIPGRYRDKGAENDRYDEDDSDNS